jgi:hypothetical protein
MLLSAESIIVSALLVTEHELRDLENISEGIHLSFVATISNGVELNSCVEKEEIQLALSIGVAEFVV